MPNKSLRDARNLGELLGLQAERLGRRSAVRWKQHGLYHDLSYEEYRVLALACASALVEAGIQPGDRVGLLAENCLAWLIADMGILTAGAVNVPPHSPLTAAQVQFQLADSGVRWLFVSSAEQLAKVQQVRADLPKLVGIVAFDRLDARGADTPRSPVSFAGFLQRGKQALARTAAELERRERALGPDDLATIMYTSGTTGNPKGVMLSHGNLLSNVWATLEADPMELDAVQLSWLPLSHIYARTMDHYHSIGAGVAMSMAESMDTLVQNIAETQPYTMNSVPRFYEKVLAMCAAAGPAEAPKRLRAVFGMRIKTLCCGGAPLPRAVADAYHAVGLLLLPGYGLTETSPVITFNLSHRYKIGTVGPALPGVEVRIAPDGEVLTRGPHVMKGYWNLPKETAETLRDGWLHTGDLGSIDAEGFLSITGRKKELLVLSNGKKVVPNFIEGLMLADPCIDQAVVCGEGRNFLTALIVPNWQIVRQALHLTNSTEEELSRNPTVNAFLQKRIDAALTEVSPWERVKKIKVLPQPFSIAADELTVSLKLRRNVVLSKHQAALEKLYAE